MTISGLSKTFSITGWRIGYCVCPGHAAQAIANFSDLVYVCAPTPLQIGAAAGLMELDNDYFERLAADYRRKRDKLCGALERAGLTPCVPPGAYYVLADISPLAGGDSAARAMSLLRDTGVACVPGESFFTGPDGARSGRFCFAKEEDVLDDACRRLEGLRGAIAWHVCRSLLSVLHHYPSGSPRPARQSFRMLERAQLVRLGPRTVAAASGHHGRYAQADDPAAPDPI